MTNARTPKPSSPSPAVALEANQMIAAANPEPLSGTGDAIRRMPEALRPLVTTLAAKLYDETFRHLTIAMLEDPAGRGEGGKRIADASRTPSMLSHSAKLVALSATGHLAGQPWHLADAACLKAIELDMEKTGSFEGARKFMIACKPVNIFVGSTESDERASYLKAVATALRKRKAHNVVLDADLIEWLPERDFLEACDIIGMLPNYVGISDRKSVERHSMMNPSTTPEAIQAVFVDTDGRKLAVGAEAAAIEVERLAADKAAQAPIIGPSTSVQDKIRLLRTRQTIPTRTAPRP